MTNQIYAKINDVEDFQTVRTRKFEQYNGPFLHGLSDRSVWKIFPSVIWEFSLGIAIEKMDAEVLFEVEAVGRDLGKIRGSIFSIKIPKENSQITRG